MTRTDFTDIEKIEAFDEIATRYFYQNFGTMTKTDFETMIFSIYLRHLKDSNQASDDYSISRKLGITQSKVRSLKLRNELQKPNLTDDSWKQAFADCVSSAVYDEKKKLVKVMVPEVTVMMELRHFIEENKWQDEYQLNPKLFQCRPEFFVLLCEKISGEDIILNEDAKEKLRKLKNSADEKEQSAISEIMGGAFKSGLQKLVTMGSGKLIVEVLKLLPFTGIAATIIGAVIYAINKTASLPTDEDE